MPRVFGEVYTGACGLAAVAALYCRLLSYLTAALKSKGTSVAGREMEALGTEQQGYEEPPSRCGSTPVC